MVVAYEPPPKGDASYVAGVLGGLKAACAAGGW